MRMQLTIRPLRHRTLRKRLSVFHLMKNCTRRPNAGAIGGKNAASRDGEWVVGQARSAGRLKPEFKTAWRCYLPCVHV